MRRIQPQHGQALAETLVMAAVMILLFLSIPLLARIADVKHQTLQAARYAAWERTVWVTGEGEDTNGIAIKSDSQLQAETRTRFFNNYGLGLDPEETKTNPLWTNHAGEQVAVNREKITLTTSNEDSPAGSSASNDAPGVYAGPEIANFASSLIGKAGSLFKDSFDPFHVNTAGLQSARVAITLEDTEGLGLLRLASLDMKDPFGREERPEKLELTASAWNVLLTDGWNAGGPPKIEESAAGLVFPNMFNVHGIAEFMGLVREIGINAPESDPTTFVQPYNVPQNRLGSNQ